MKLFFTVLIPLSLLMLNACAFNVQHMKQIPAELKDNGKCTDSFVLEQDAKVSVGPIYTRVLKQNTRWHCVGIITQGKVFKTRDQVLTVEANNVYEAHIVMTGNILVGFYLPVEKTFTPIGTPKKLIKK